MKAPIRRDLVAAAVAGFAAHPAIGVRPVEEIAKLAADLAMAASAESEARDGISFYVNSDGVQEIRDRIAKLEEQVFHATHDGSALSIELINERVKALEESLGVGDDETPVARGA